MKSEIRRSQSRLYKDGPCILGHEPNECHVACRDVDLSRLGKQTDLITDGLSRFGKMSIFAFY
jgi:hypothetical protein